MTTSFAIDLSRHAHPGYLTLGQAAERLGCTTDEVFQKVRAQEIPAVCTPRTGMIIAEQDLLRS
jgi:excisionase family DNA binding protein